jgi:hypothetical protein
MKKRKNTKFAVPKDLQQAFLAKLKGSGLTVKDADQLGILVMTKAEAELRLPEVRPYGDCMAIPYRDVDGKLIDDFCRVRYLDELGGWKGITRKQRRYSQPPGTGCKLYFPHLPTIEPWRMIATNSAISLLVVEGELKAACGCTRGIPTVGLGGVQNFSEEMLRACGVRWKGRSVYVAYDPDVRTNPDVLRARNRLCDVLTNLGAQVFLVDLPQKLDDYMVGQGKVSEAKPEFEKLCEKAEGWAVWAELQKMNELAIHVHFPTSVYVYADDAFYRKADFVMNHSTWKVVVDHGQGKTKQYRVPEFWINDWAQHSWCKRLTFQPHEQPYTLNTNKEFNMFRGLPEPEEGDVEPFLELLTYLFSQDQTEARRWFEQWLAYPLQAIRDGKRIKMHSCAALIGFEGTGKTLVGRTVGQIYGKAYQQVTTSELRSEFTGWALHKLFLHGDEITGDDSRKDADRLKSFITEDSIMINQKYIAAFQISNLANWYFTSNHPDAFQVPLDDRRYFVHRTSDEKLILAWGKQKLDEYFAWMQNGSTQALHWYLLKVDMSGFDDRQPLRTVAKELMQERTVNWAVLWAKRVRENPEKYLRLGDKNLSYRRLWTARSLLSLFNLGGESKYGEPAFGSALRAAGWWHVRNGEQIDCGKQYGKLRLWALPKFKEELSRLGGAELREMYCKQIPV